MKIEGDVVIIGGGPGGYVAAIEAAKNGLNTVLVEEDKLGGTCLNRGCIPTKALVRSAEVYELLKNAEDYGVANESPSFDIKKVMERKNSIVNELVGGIEYLMSKNKITVVNGKGDIADKNTVVVTTEDGETTIDAKNIIIATGSVPFVPPITGVDKSKNIYTSNEMLELEELPEKLVVVGGGVIGMEFAFICNSFGVDVTVIEFLDDVLFNFDSDIRREVTRVAKRIGINLYVGSKVEEVIDTRDGKTIVQFERRGKKEFVTADKVLMSVGRAPNYSGIDLEKLGIEENERPRGIKVNEKLQTSVDNIYAIGDVTNIMQLAHVASYQGIVAIANIMGKDVAADYAIVPSAVFITPELASVGLTEDIAKEKGIEISVGKFPFSANGKALTYGERRGVAKIITDKETGVVLGGAIVGPNAADLIHEVTVAAKNKLTAQQLIDTIHAHPTTAESVLEAMMATTDKGAIHSA